MMKKLIVVLSLILTIVLSFTGCTVDKYGAIKLNGEPQNTSYYVTSNGGSAVKYGNYVYFINGSRGYDDEEGKDNKFGSVVKGGLYRAEFVGANNSEDAKDFVPQIDDKTGLALVSTQSVSYKRQTEYVVNNQLLVPKTIGTSGYSDGGIFIFDDYVYYATPANTKDKSGNIMDNYTLFLRTKIDGSKTEEIYTSQSETSDKPYGFYKYEGKVYLVVLENNTEYGNYVNVIDVASKKVTTVATKVDSVIFPTNPVYYNGMGNDSVYDHIYIRYSANNFPAYRDDKVNRTGYVLASMRPNGKEIVNFAEGNSSLELVAVRDNLVFYKDMYQTQTVLVARDNTSMFKDGEEGFNQRVFSEASNLTSSSVLYPFVEGVGAINTNAISVLAVNSSTTSSGSTSTTTQTLTYYSSVYTQGRNIATNVKTIQVQAHDNTGFYYIVSDGTETSLKYHNLASGSATSKIINSSVGTNALKADKVGPYIVYNATLEEKFDDYTFFTNIYGSEDYAKNSVFVGTRVDGDVRSSIESIVVYEDTLDSVKTEYVVGDTLDVTNLKIVLKYYEDEEGNVEEKVVDVDKDWVSGFDSSSASESLSLTISYTDGHDSFATTFTVSIG